MKLKSNYILQEMFCFSPFGLYARSLFVALWRRAKGQPASFPFMFDLCRPHTRPTLGLHRIPLSLSLSFWLNSGPLASAARLGPVWSGPFSLFYFSMHLEVSLEEIYISSKCISKETSRFWHLLPFPLCYLLAQNQQVPV